MTRLFVAVDLPSVVTNALAAIQPPNVSGVRLVPADQMHVTLHYIGVAEVDQIATALLGVTAPELSILIHGVGQFKSANGDVTLWAGIRECVELRNLHAQVGSALAPTGFRPEARPYTPHVTLARCGQNVETAFVDDFLARHADLSLPPVSLNGFSLYSSEFIGDAPAYKQALAFIFRRDVSN